MAKRTDPQDLAGREKILQLPNVRSSLDKATHYAAESVKKQLADEFESFILEHPIGSPIEAIFLAWWIALRASKTAIAGEGYELDVDAQWEIQVDGMRTYRLDFRVGLVDADLAWEAHKLGISYQDIGIELDGHEWHERTKEQVADRNQRDRDLQKLGWKIFHFSGSELIKDPIHCLDEVMEFASEAFWELKRALRRRKQELAKQ